jgi:hypothetical protein
MLSRLLALPVLLLVLAAILLLGACSADEGGGGASEDGDGGAAEQVVISRDQFVDRTGPFVFTRYDVGFRDTITKRVSFVTVDERCGVQVRIGSPLPPCAQ